MGTMFKRLFIASVISSAGLVGCGGGSDSGSSSGSGSITDPGAGNIDEGNTPTDERVIRNIDFGNVSNEVSKDMGESETR